MYMYHKKLSEGTETKKGRCRFPTTMRRVWTICEQVAWVQK